MMVGLDIFTDLQIRFQLHIFGTTVRSPTDLGVLLSQVQPRQRPPERNCISGLRISAMHMNMA